VLIFRGCFSYQLFIRKSNNRDVLSPVRRKQERKHGQTTESGRYALIPEIRNDTPTAFHCAACCIVVQIEKEKKVDHRHKNTNIQHLSVNPSSLFCLPYPNWPCIRYNLLSLVVGMISTATSTATKTTTVAAAASTTTPATKSTATATTSPTATTATKAATATASSTTTIVSCGSGGLLKMKSRLVDTLMRHYELSTLEFGLIQFDGIFYRLFILINLTRSVKREREKQEMGTQTLSTIKNINL
jgi:hypothetical protein